MKRLSLKMLPQPNDVTCGPTCLHAVYEYYGRGVALEELVRVVPQLELGGTLAVLLGIDALRRGFSATIYTYNLRLFDPTWFVDSCPGGEFTGEADAGMLCAKLEAQSSVKDSPLLRLATGAYLEFLGLGGRVKLWDRPSRVIREHLERGVPVLTGLSATYLYLCSRETPHDNEYDDIRGEVSGHFVVLCGYRAEGGAEGGEVQVKDPLADNPRGWRQDYVVSMERLVSAIMQGSLTYDSNLLIIEPVGV